jgi:hypothetical protein
MPGTCLGHQLAFARHRAIACENSIRGSGDHYKSNAAVAIQFAAGFDGSFLAEVSKRTKPP